MFFSPLVLVSDEDDQESIMVTFDLPQSQLLKLKPVLVLAFKSPPADGELGVIFSSQSLQPNTQVQEKKNKKTLCCKNVGHFLCVLRKLPISWQVQEYLGPQAEFHLAPLFQLITNNSSKLSLIIMPLT